MDKQELIEAYEKATGKKNGKFLKEDDLKAKIAEASGAPKSAETTDTSKDELIDRLESQLEEERRARESQGKNFQDQLDTLMMVADKRKLSKINGDVERGAKCRISLFREAEDKAYRVVMGWKTIANVAQNLGQKSERLDQRMEIYLEDETALEMPTEDFLKEGLSKAEVDIVEKKERKINGIMRRVYVVEYNGKEYELPIQFIN